MEDVDLHKAPRRAPIFCSHPCSRSRDRRSPSLFAVPWLPYGHSSTGPMGGCGVVLSRSPQCPFVAPTLCGWLPGCRCGRSSRCATALRTQESRAGEEWPPRECSVPTSCARLRPKPHPPQPPRILCGVDGSVCGVGRGCAASTPRLVLLRMPPFALPPCLINLFPRCVFLLAFSATPSSPLSACSCLFILLILCHVHACPLPSSFPSSRSPEIDLLALFFCFSSFCFFLSLFALFEPNQPYFNAHPIAGPRPRTPL